MQQYSQMRHFIVSNDSYQVYAIWKKKKNKQKKKTSKKKTEVTVDHVAVQSVVQAKALYYHSH